MTNYSERDERLAKTECSVVVMYEKYEKSRQEDARKRITFDNLRDDSGNPLDVETREWNIGHWVSRATDNKVHLLSKDYSHYLPRTTNLSFETQVKFESLEQAQIVVQYIKKTKKYRYKRKQEPKCAPG